MKKLTFTVFVCLMLLGAFGCKEAEQEYSFLGVGRVDVIGSTGDEFYVSLKLVTTEEYEEITVIATDASVDFRSTVKPMKRVFIDGRKQEAYTYLIQLQFLVPAKMEKITLQLDDIIADFGVGHVEAVLLDKQLTASVNDSPEHLNVVQIVDIEQMGSFLKPARIALHLNNQTSNAITIQAMSLVASPKDTDMRLVNIIKKNPRIGSFAQEEFSYIYFNETKEEIQYASSIVKIEYDYLGESFVKYVTVNHGYTDELLTSAIMGATIHEKALIPGVIRAKNTD